MEKKKLRKIVYVVVGSIALLYCSNIMYQFYISFSQKLPISFDLPKDYQELFLEDKRSQINSVYTDNSKVRTSVSNFKFNNDYSLTIFKLPIQKDVSLIKVIKMSQGNAYFTKGIVYSDVGQEGIVLKCRSGVQKKLSTLYLKLNGDALKTIVKNDSVVSYALNFRNFSLSYGLEDDVGCLLIVILAFCHSENRSRSICYLKREMDLFILSCFLVMIK
jgi:hypothetical protein